MWHRSVLSVLLDGGREIMGPKSSSVRLTLARATQDFASKSYQQHKKRVGLGLPTIRKWGLE